MEKLVRFLPWYLEVREALSRDNWLSACAAIDDCFSLHASPPTTCLVFLVRQLVPDRFQVPVGLLQSDAGLVDGFEDNKVVDSNAHFVLVFSKKPLNKHYLYT